MTTTIKYSMTGLHTLTHTFTMSLKWSTPLAKSKEVKEEGEDLTLLGHFYTTWNAADFLASTFRNLETLLCRDEKPDEFLANSQAFVVVTNLHHIYDAVATYCHRFYGHPEYEGFIYFDTYPFDRTETAWIRKYRKVLQDLKFGDNNFNKFANKLKHHQCYIGQLVYATDHQMWDFQCMQNQLIHDVIKKACKNLVRLLDELRRRNHKEHSFHSIQF